MLDLGIVSLHPWRCVFRVRSRADSVLSDSLSNRYPYDADKNAIKITIPRMTLALTPIASPSVL